MYRRRSVVALAGLAGALAVCALVSYAPAKAAPVAGLSAIPATAKSSVVDEVRRRYWRHHHHWWWRWRRW